MKLDLRQLRHVLALDRHRNFARAAEDVGLTQPALSRSIQALEETIGVKLFDRDRAGVVPTATGARLVELAQPLVMQARLAERELEQIRSLSSGLLRIGAGPFAAEISVGTAVGRLACRHPGLTADVSVADWPALYRRLLAHELDIVVAESSHAVDDDRFVIEPLPSHEAVFYCRAEHPLAGRSELTLDDVTAFPLALPFLPRRLVEVIGKGKPSMAQTSHLEGVIAMEFRVETPYLARRIVLESDVISIAVPLQIEHELALGRLVALPLRLPWLKSQYGVMRLAGRSPSPAEDEFLRILREVEQAIDATTA